MAENTRFDKPLGNRDLELLSAYIDGELSAREQAQLETRLAQDATLQAELEALQVAVSLVRSLPELQIPRNFTLDRAQYGHVIPAGGWRWLRLGTPLVAGASLVLVAVLAGVLLLARGSDISRLAAPPADVAELDAAVEVEAAAPAEEAVEEAAAPAAEAVEEAAEAEAELLEPSLASEADEAAALDAAEPLSEGANAQEAATDGQVAGEALSSITEAEEAPVDESAAARAEDSVGAAVALPTSLPRAALPEVEADSGVGAEGELADDESRVASTLAPAAPPPQQPETPGVAEAPLPEAQSAPEQETAQVFAPDSQLPADSGSSLALGIAIGAAVALFVLLGAAIVGAVLIRRGR